MDDDRVDTAEVRVSIAGSSASETLTITINAVLVDGSGFTLILEVSELTVQILEDPT
jgi:hypothetical protein